MIKTISFVYLAVLLIGFLFLFKTTIPLCYQAPEEKPITAFVLYDEEIIDKIREDIAKRPFYLVKINGQSMEPTIKHNDVCVCYSEQNYNVNDIIAFYVPLDNKIELVSHRIIEENDGFKTKGDGNKAPDSQLIEEKQIFCKVPETTLFDKFRFAIMEERFSIFN